MFYAFCLERAHVCLVGGRGLPGVPGGGSQGSLGGVPGPMSAAQKWLCPLGSILKDHQNPLEKYVWELPRGCRLTRLGAPGGYRR